MQSKVNILPEANKAPSAFSELAHGDYFVTGLGELLRKQYCTIKGIDYNAVKVGTYMGANLIPETQVTRVDIAVQITKRY